MDSRWCEYSNRFSKTFQNHMGSSEVQSIGATLVNSIALLFFFLSFWNDFRNFTVYNFINRIQWTNILSNITHKSYVKLYYYLRFIHKHFTSKYGTAIQPRLKHPLGIEFIALQFYVYLQHLCIHYSRVFLFHSGLPLMFKSYIKVSHRRVPSTLFNSNEILCISFKDTSYRNTSSWNNHHQVHNVFFLPAGSFA